MPEGIGYDLQDMTPEEKNVFSWKEFLMRPENLATALVLATGVTSERRPNQSKLNKALEAGTGALGFRGGLEQNVRAQRKDQRTEAREAEAQAETIAAQQAQTRQGDIQVQNQRRAADASMVSARAQAQNAATDASIAGSTMQENQARAGLYNAQARALGQETQLAQAPYVAQAVAGELEQATLVGRPPDLAGAMRRGIQVQTIMDKYLKGEVGPDGRMIFTDEEAALMGISVEEQQPQTPAAQKPKGGGKTKDFRRTGHPIGMLVGDKDEQTHAIMRMKQKPGFEEMDDTSILDRVEEARKLANDKEKLRELNGEALQTLLDNFSGVLSPSEQRNVRKQLAYHKPGPPMPSVRGIR